MRFWKGSMAVLEDLQQLLASCRDLQSLYKNGSSRNLTHFACHGFATIMESQILDHYIPGLCNMSVNGLSKDPEAALDASTAASTASNHCDFGQAARLYSKSLRYSAVSAQHDFRTVSRLHSSRASCLTKQLQPGTAAQRDLSKLALQIGEHRALCCMSFTRVRVVNMKRKNCKRGLSALNKSVLADLEGALLDCVEARKLDKTNVEAAYCHASVLMEMLRTSEAHEVITNILASGVLSTVDQRRLQQLLKSLPEETAASRTENAAPEQQKRETNDPASLSTADQMQGCKVAMLVDEAEGRHYVAASNIHSGEVLLDEAPLAAVVCKSFQKLCCWWCFEIVDQHKLFSCPTCAAAIYCTPACRDSDRNHRSGFCGQPWALLLPEQAVLAAYTVLFPQEGAAWYPKLVHHFGKHSYRVAADHLALASLISACYRHSNPGHEESLRIDGVYEVILQIEANGIAIVPQETSSANDRRAIALYASASMFNHSCDSPLSLSFQRRSIRVQSNANLPAGSRLDICYGPQVGELIREQRQNLLWQQYQFKCNCDACLEPPSAEAGLVHLKCSRCGGPVRLSMATAPGICSLYALEGSNEPCLSCGECVDDDTADAALKQLSLAARMFSSASIVVKGGDAGDARADGASQQAAQDIILPAVQECLKIQHRWLYRSNQLLGQTHSLLAFIHDSLGCKAKALDHSKAVLDIVKTNFGPTSSQYAHCLQQLSMSLCPA